MVLIIGLRFDFLTFPTPYSFAFGQITIEKTEITNDQVVLRITNIR